jgi:hypothetical protein
VLQLIKGSKTGAFRRKVRLLVDTMIGEYGSVLQKQVCPRFLVFWEFTIGDKESSSKTRGCYLSRMVVRSLLINYRTSTLTVYLQNN